MNLSIRPAALLRSKIQVGLPLLFASGDGIYEGENVRERYTEYLTMLHGTVRASVPLMEMAADICERKYPDDPVAVGLAEYLKEHIPEEMGHDDWLLEDLELLGVSRNDVLGRAPSASIAALVGAQYYWMIHHHPVALLGYIAVMEGYPPAVERIDQLIEETSLPRGAFRTLRKHAFLDPHHRDSLNDALDELPLTREHQSLIGMSALHTMSAASDALQEVAGRFRDKP